MIKGFNKHSVQSNTQGEKFFSENAFIGSPVGPSVGRSYGGGSFNASIAYPDVESEILQGLLNFRDPATVRNIYRDIYYHDVIAGGAVDIQSTLPFSDFTITGISDPEIMKTYQNSLENMYISTLMPSLNTDYLVMGAFCGIPNFNAGTGEFESLLTINLDMCEVLPAPLFNFDPLIDITFDSAMQVYLKDNDSRLKYYQDMMPNWLKKGIEKGKVRAHPANIIYIPRRGLSTSSLGTSYFRRILPIFILEKALLKGTISSAYRRQRAVLHLSIGDDEWEPTNEELDSYAAQFAQADMDPIGAILATRNGVQPQEIRNGADLWKYDDIFNFAADAKMRGLNISEAILSAEASYATLDSALSLFTDQLKQHRENITHEVFYERLFPDIAIANNFKRKNPKSFVGSSDTFYKDEATDEYHAVISGAHRRTREVKDISEYLMPKVQWHKQLQPRGDREYVDMLTALSEKGVPVPLRMMATASGTSLSEIMDGYSEDLEAHKKIQEYNDKLKEITGEGEGEEEGFGAFGSANGSTTGSGLKRKSLLSRDFSKLGDEYKPHVTDNKGNRKPVSSKRQKELDEINNKMLAIAAAEKNEQEIQKENEEFKDNSTKTIYS